MRRFYLCDYKFELYHRALIYKKGYFFEYIYVH